MLLTSLLLASGGVDTCTGLLDGGLIGSMNSSKGSFLIPGAGTRSQGNPTAATI